MPTYEYHCEKCQKNFDAFQSMKDKAWDTCPEKFCQEATWGQGKVKRLLGTGAGLIFKGSGFYITDYRSAGYKESAKKEAASAGESKSAESKPSAETKSANHTPTPAAAPAAEKPKPASPKPSSE
jgi:putative FmdB family regulatory protein